MMKKISLLLILLLPGCTLGPDYKRPPVITPVDFKEVPEGWKIASPQDDCDRGPWWEVFKDEKLNALEENLTISNQNIQLALAQYQESRALVAQAKAAFFPVVAGASTFTRSQSSGAKGFTGISSAVDNAANSKPKMLPVLNDYNLTLDASWEPDIWGLVRRTVEGAVGGAQASKAELAQVALSMQATLAQYYFQLKGLDADQFVLDKTVANYQKLLKITQHQYQAGTVSQSAILQVKSQLELAQVQALNNGIARAQYEHAIAVLTGCPPANFSLATSQDKTYLPTIPVMLPSTLLERRPDISQSERLVMQANAQIGVAIAAYFPTLTLTGIGGYDSSMLQHLFTRPARFWSLAAGLADTIFDGGLRSAQVDFAKAGYDATVASYRQTVLNAFQDVEDNLVALSILAKEIDIQHQAVETSVKALDVVLNEYKAGTAQLADVLNAELTLFVAQKGENDIAYRQMTGAVGLIKALGGGWHAEELMTQ